MDETNKLLNDILFQLHVISSQNYTAMSMTDGEDPVSEKTREYGMDGLNKELKWMHTWLESRGVAECPSGTGS